MSRRQRPRAACDRSLDGEQVLAAWAGAILRLLLLAVVELGNHLSAHPVGGTVTFDAVMAVAVAYSVAVLVASWRRGPGMSHGARLVIDLALISALAFCSGRGFFAVRAAFVVAPVTAAMFLGPRRTAAMSAAIAVVYVVIALTHPASTHLPLDDVLAHSLFIVWSGTSAVVMSYLRVERQRRIVALSQTRGRLVAQTIAAEERVRKQISGVLHDNIIQDLLTARQDLVEAAAGDAEGFGRVHHALDLALCQLRAMIEDLDPYLLDHLELPAVLETIAARAQRHGDCRIEVDVEPLPDHPHTELVASLARELLTNAVRHAGAARVTLSLRRRDGSLVLEVTDDGCGFTDEQALRALRAGHIGLAATRERVDAVEGVFTLDSAPGAGTRISCVLPLPAAPAVRAPAARGAAAAVLVSA